MFGGYLFKYCRVKCQTFHQVCDKASVKRLTPKSYLKSFLDASNSHETSANLSVRAYFRQFSDWQETYSGHSQESPGSREKVSLHQIGFPP